MKHSKKMTLATMVLSSVILTGCFFQDVPSSEGNNSSSSSSPTKTLSPKEIKEVEAKIDDEYKPTEPIKIDDKPQGSPDELTGSEKEELKEIKEQISNTPLGMDISKIKIPEEVAGTFPESDFDTQEGMRVALSTYQNISAQTNLYAPRDTSKDWESFGQPYASSMMSYFVDDLEKSMDSRDKEGANKHLLYSSGDGTLISLPNENIIPAGVPYIVYGDPIVDTAYNENYDVTTGRISFIKNIEFRATNGHSYRVKDKVDIYFAPVGENEWYVADMWHQVLDVEEVR